MDYFSFFGLEPKFHLDTKALKLLYYEKMKALHPDMQIGASVEHQNETLRLSAINNEAYKVLKDFHRRLKYILDTYYPGQEPPSQKLPQLFLMDMMDMNDELLELKMDFDAEKADKMKTDLQHQLHEMEAEITSKIMDKKVEGLEKEVFDEINAYLLKKNYLVRALENLKG